MRRSGTLGRGKRSGATGAGTGQAGRANGEPDKGGPVTTLDGSHPSKTSEDGPVSALRRPVNPPPRPSCDKFFLYKSSSIYWATVVVWLMGVDASVPSQRLWD